MRDFIDDLFLPQAEIDATHTPGCVSGTIITTIQGHVPIEALLPGMKVLTKDNGFAPVRALHRHSYTAETLRSRPDLQPLMIPQDALGNDRDLHVSPGQKLLTADAAAEVMLGSFEVLMTAQHMTGHAAVQTAGAIEHVTYVSLVLDNHELVLCNGLWADSLFLTPASDPEIRRSDEWIGPTVDYISHRRAARPMLRGYETALLCAGGAHLGH